MTGLREAGLSNVFVDTSAVFALTDRGDRNHEAALAVQRSLVEARSRLFTTNFVLVETHALLLNRLGRAVALRVLTSLDRGSATIERVSRADEDRARAIIRQYDDKDFSLTDATSFAVMERLQITQAFCFDRNFSQYGFYTRR